MSLARRESNEEKHHARSADAGAPLSLETCAKYQMGGDALRIEVSVESWDEFHLRVTASLREMAVRSELSPEDAEDAIAEVWLAVLQNLHLFVGNCTFRDFLILEEAFFRGISSFFRILEGISSLRK